jgi:hypothetical protein
MKEIRLMHHLIELWRKCPLDNPPFILPGDENYLDKNDFYVFRSLEEYTSSDAFGLKNDPRLHLGLIPVPYIGNLEKASIFILMLNPGFSHGDYFAEYNIAEYREAIIGNLRQSSFSAFLNPHFAWQAGFEYWQKRLHEIVDLIAKNFHYSYQDALSLAEKNIACLELFPYHSKNFKAPEKMACMPSVQAIKDFVHEIVIPKVYADEAIAIVTRGVNRWNLLKHENIIFYKGGEPRAAYLTKESKEAIFKRLTLK